MFSLRLTTITGLFYHQCFIFAFVPDWKLAYLVTAGNGETSLPSKGHNENNCDSAKTIKGVSDGGNMASAFSYDRWEQISKVTTQ